MPRSSPLDCKRGYLFHAKNASMEEVTSLLTARSSAETKSTEEQCWKTRVRAEQRSKVLPDFGLIYQNQPIKIKH